MSKSQNKQAQVAMEFVMLIAVVLIVLVLFFLLNTSSQKELAEEREYTALADLAYSIRTELYTATSVSDGYYRIFNLPAQIDGRDYNITKIGDVIELAGQYTSFALQVPLFNGTLALGNNTLRKTDNDLQIN